MRSVIRSTAIFVAICVISVALLAVCNYFWKVEKPQGLSEELRAALSTLVGGEDFGEVDTDGIALDESVTAVYRALDGANKDTLIFHMEKPAGGTGYVNVSILVAVDNATGSVLAVADFESAAGADSKYSNPLKEDALANLTGKGESDINNSLLGDAVTGATRTADTLTAVIKTALNLYGANSAALLAAPLKVNEDLTVSVTVSAEAETGESVTVTAKIGGSKYDETNTSAYKLTLTYKYGTLSEDISVAYDSSLKAYVGDFTPNNEGEYTVTAKAESTDGKYSATAEATVTVATSALWVDGTAKIKVALGSAAGTVKLTAYDYAFSFSDDNGSTQSGTVTATVTIDMATNKIVKSEGSFSASVWPIDDYDIFAGEDVTVEPDYDVQTGSTKSLNAFKRAVVKALEYYLDNEEFIDTTATISADMRKNVNKFFGCGLFKAEDDYYRFIDGSVFAVSGSYSIQEPGVDRYGTVRAYVHADDSLNILGLHLEYVDEHGVMESGDSFIDSFTGKGLGDIDGITTASPIYTAEAVKNAVKNALGKLA